MYTGSGVLEVEGGGVSLECVLDFLFVAFLVEVDVIKVVEVVVLIVAVAVVVDVDEPIALFVNWKLLQILLIEVLSFIAMLFNDVVGDEDVAGRFLLFRVLLLLSPDCDLIIKLAVKKEPKC